MRLRWLAKRNEGKCCNGMRKRYQGVSKARRDLGILHVRWMVEKRIEENRGMMKEVVISAKGRVPEKGPSEMLDFGKHAWKTFRQVYLEDPGYCNWTVKQDKPGAGSYEIETLQVFLSVKERSDPEESWDSWEGK